MKFWNKVCLLTLAMMLCVGSVLASDSGKIAKEKSIIRNKVAVTLENLYELKPHAKRVIAECPGYAVFVNTGFRAVVLGSGHGRGLAKNNRTGEEVFMKMGEYSLGVGVGAKEYSMVFVFGTQDAYNKFVNSGWKCNAEGELTAKDGDKGGAYEGAVCIGPEIWVYQMATRGLMASVDLKGTEYFRNKKLSPR